MNRMRLPRLLGERRLKISDLVRETENNPDAVTRLHHGNVERIDRDSWETLSRHPDVYICDTPEWTDREEPTAGGKTGRE